MSDIEIYLYLLILLINRAFRKILTWEFYCKMYGKPSMPYIINMHVLAIGQGPGIFFYDIINEKIYSILPKRYSISLILIIDRAFFKKDYDGNFTIECMASHRCHK